MKKNLFITATNTGVGKSVISSLICKKLLETDTKVAYYKPIQTGGDSNSSPDCDFLKSVVGDNKNFMATHSYLFRKPASPHYASQLESISIDKKRIVSDYTNISCKYDFVVVEGAGGLLVPLDKKGLFISSIPKILNLNLLLVSDGGLGAINNVLLNYFYCKKNGIKLKVIILLYKGESPTDIELDNYNTIQNITKIDHIYLLKAVKHVDTEKLSIGEIKEATFLNLDEVRGWFL